MSAQKISGETSGSGAPNENDPWNTHTNESQPRDGAEVLRQKMLRKINESPSEFANGTHSGANDGAEALRQAALRSINKSPSEFYHSAPHTVGHKSNENESYDRARKYNEGVSNEAMHDAWFEGQDGYPTWRGSDLDDERDAGNQNRGKYFQGPDGTFIPKEQYDAVMEAYEREEYYKKNSSAKKGNDLNPVKIGEIKLDEIENKIERIDEQRIEQLEKDLKGLLPYLAELYARNRRLIVGSTKEKKFKSLEEEYKLEGNNNKAKFAEIKGKYGEMLDEYLRLKAKQNNVTRSSKAMEEINASMETLASEIKTKLTEFAGGDLEKTDKTQEELDAEKQRLIKAANKIIDEEYGDKMEAVKTSVNADFIKDLLKAEIDMEEATINALDKGTFCRKFVHKVVNNKVIKALLLSAGIAGLAVTGVGLATGAVTIGIGFTAGGVAAGTGKGAAGGFLMSRQDSRKSAIRGFGEGSTEDIKRIFDEKQINILAESSDDASVKATAQLIMEEYGKANQEDRKSNIKKTAIAAGIGAAVGGLMSVVHFNTTTEAPYTTTQVVGHTPDQQVPNVDISTIYHNQGEGMNHLFRQLGGQGDAPVEILREVGQEFGLELGNSSWTYPGYISEWPQLNQDMFQSFVDKCIARNLIPPITISGNPPLYNETTNAIAQYIPNALYEKIARSLEAILPAGIGGMIGSIRERVTSRETLVKPAEPDSSTEPKPTEPRPTEPTEPESGSKEKGAEDIDDAEAAAKAIVEFSNSLIPIIGGSDGTIERFFIRKENTPAPSSPEYFDYWENLDEETQQSIRKILENVPPEHQKDLGDDFRRWLAVYDETRRVADNGRKPKNLPNPS